MSSPVSRETLRPPSRLRGVSLLLLPQGPQHTPSGHVGEDRMAGSTGDKGCLSHGVLHSGPGTSEEAPPGALKRTNASTCLAISDLNINPRLALCPMLSNAQSLAACGYFREKKIKYSLKFSSSVAAATRQVLNSRTWSVETELDRVDTQHRVDKQALLGCTTAGPYQDRPNSAPHSGAGLSQTEVLRRVPVLGQHPAQGHRRSAEGGCRSRQETPLLHDPHCHTFPGQVSSPPTGDTQVPTPTRTSPEPPLPGPPGPSP